MTPPRELAGGDDELLDQWSFLDSMIERQASSLHAGAQDPEEHGPAIVASVVTPPGAEAPDTRISALEDERGRLQQALDEARADLTAVRRSLEEVVRLRSDLETERRARHRAEGNSADLMLALRDAHAAVEAARTAVTAPAADVTADQVPPPAPDSAPWEPEPLPELPVTGAVQACSEATMPAEAPPAEPPPAEPAPAEAQPALSWMQRLFGRRG